jgi:hypothetical protein
VSALPANLARVGDDLARATARDAQRSRKRRRAATCVAVLVLLALMATAAVANGWLLGESPTADAVPSLAGSEPRTLLTGLGPDQRTLTAATTPSGVVCLTLSGYQTQCIPTFTDDQELAWLAWSSQSGPTLVWGIVRDRVVGVDAVSAAGVRTAAQFGHDAFYLELSGGMPAQLVAHLADGGTKQIPIGDCSPSAPDCPD